MLLIERAVVSLLRLCLILAQKVTVTHQTTHPLYADDPAQPSLRDQIYVSFDLISGLPQSVVSSVGEQVVAGVILIVQKHRDIIRSLFYHAYSSFHFPNFELEFSDPRQNGIFYLRSSVPIYLTQKELECRSISSQPSLLMDQIN